uniref:Uncharacterized protein n=1 Tax=Anopheles albimanus TaxID=7167 RepID=A0A182FXU2_ANOAL
MAGMVDSSSSSCPGEAGRNSSVPIAGIGCTTP